MTITLPLSVTLPRKTKADKVWILNLNSYRNAHYHILSDAKETWKSIVMASLQGSGVLCGDLPNCPPYRFTYTLFPNSNRRTDLANVLSIVQKFTDDALVEYGIIPDDCHKIIPVIIYQFGHVDKDRPRVELQIDSLDPLHEVCEIAKEVGL